jgi:DMSO reductase anchor subunit
MSQADYINNVIKTHPEWVSLLIFKHSGLKGATLENVLRSNLISDTFLKEWFVKLHPDKVYNSADGDTFWNKFKSWFNDATTVLTGTSAIVSTVNNSVNPNSQQEITAKEKALKTEKNIWTAFIVVCSITVFLLVIYLIAKK